MELTDLVVGQNYAFVRITKKIIRMKLLYKGMEDDRIYIRYQIHNELGPSGISNLRPEELATFTLIAPDPNEKKEQD